MIDVPTRGALDVPVAGLVVLVGPSGSGKSDFAERLFRPFEVVSSDHCRALIAGSEDDQAVTPEAFDLLRFIARPRLIATVRLRRNPARSEVSLASAMAARYVPGHLRCIPLLAAEWSASQPVPSGS